MAKILIKAGKFRDGERFFLSDVLTDNENIIEIADIIDETANFEVFRSADTEQFLIQSAMIKQKLVHTKWRQIRNYYVYEYS